MLSTCFLCHATMEPQGTFTSPRTKRIVAIELCSKCHGTIRVITKGVSSWWIRTIPTTIPDSPPPTTRLEPQAPPTQTPHEEQPPV